MTLTHPLVGELVLDWDAYSLPGSPGPMLIAYTTPHPSPTAERLQLLATLLTDVTHANP